MPLITRFNHSQSNTGPTSPSTPSYPPSSSNNSARSKLAGFLNRRGSASTGPPSSPSNTSKLSRGDSDASATSLRSAAAAADSSLFISDFRNEKEAERVASTSPTSPTRPPLTVRRPSRLWSALTPKPAPESSFIVHHATRSASVTSAAINPATASSLQLVTCSPAVSPDERPTSSSGASAMGAASPGGFALHSFRKASESGRSIAAAAAVAAAQQEEVAAYEDDWRPPGAGDVGGWAHQHDEPELLEASTEAAPQRSASPSPQRKASPPATQRIVPIAAPAAVPTSPMAPSSSPPLLEPPTYPQRAISPSPSGTMAAGRFRRNVRSRSDLFADDDDVPLAALASGATTPNVLSSPVLGARRLSARSPAEELAALEAELAKGRMTPRTFVRAKDAVEEAGTPPPVPYKEMRSREGSFAGAQMGSRPRVRQYSSTCSLSSLRGGLEGAASAGGSGGMDSASILASRGWTGEEGGQPATLLDALARLERRGASSSAVAEEDEIAPPRRPWVDSAASGSGARERSASSASTGTPGRADSAAMEGGALGLSSVAQGSATVTTSSSVDTIQASQPKVAATANSTALAAKPAITFVTGNAHKLREVRQILAVSPDFAFELVNQDLDTPEVQGTTQEVARAKCKAAAQIIRGPVITEDTALGFTALKDLPGPYIKDFMKAVGHDGLNRMLDGFSDRSATALCTFAFCAGPDADVLLFEGKTRGRIVQARGPTHFGWDAIMEIDGTGLTYAEMESEQKNSLSHRYKALGLLQIYLTSLSAGLNA